MKAFGENIKIEWIWGLPDLGAYLILAFLMILFRNFDGYDIDLYDAVMKFLTQ